MGCLNNKVQTQKLPTYIQKTPEQSQGQHQEHPKSIAFQIPNSQIKLRKGKPSRLNKQLYIIREVSNMNHELVESPLKQSNQKQVKIDNIPQQLQIQPIQIKQRRHAKTSKDLSTGSDKNDQNNQNTKTANFIPEDPPLEVPQRQPVINRHREDDNRSRRSDNRSQLSNRYSEEVEGMQSSRKKKRKGSLSLDANSDYTYHSIHFKRAKTFHGEDELVKPTKSLSLNRGQTDARSSNTPGIIYSKLGGVSDIENQIKQIGQQSEQNPQLLQLYFSLSQAHQQKGELQEAIAANTKYLRLARKLSGVDSCNYGAGLSHLSSIYYSLENYQKAIENSMKAKSIRSYSAIENDMHKARVLNQIGLIQLEQNHLKQAMHYLEEVKDIHTKVVKQFQLNLQDMVSQTNKSPSKNEYYNRSVQSMQIALKICLRVFGENHLQTANHLDDLATSYCDAGRYHDSLDSFNRCFSIIRQMRLSKHKDYEAHTKHFLYNVEVIKLSPSCDNSVILKAIRILQKYFPQNQLIHELKNKKAMSSRGGSLHE